MYNDKIKFSLWCDFLERNFILGEFCELINSGLINGATSNPSIFAAAFKSGAYGSEISGKPKQIYEAHAKADIRLAAERLLKNFVSGDDGFVSIEVDPNLCDDDKESFKEGKHLYSAIGMPNVMIKLPATKAGFKAMSELMERGINVNATLVFSLQQAKKCLEAMEEGSKKFEKRFPYANKPKGVISIFVSRFDRILDDKLPENLRAKTGIMNASKIYIEIEKYGLNNVRALFASTGVKGDNLPKDYYVKELLYPNSINTAPLETIKAFASNTQTPKKVPSEGEIEAFFRDIENQGVNLEKVSQKLLEDGLSAFVKSFNEILEGFAEK